jgi:hypothetical protein
MLTDFVNYGNIYKIMRLILPFAREEVIEIIIRSWSAAKSVDTVCGIICIESKGDKLCQVITQNTQRNLENKQ